MIHWLQVHGWWPFHVHWSDWTGQLLAGLLRTLEYTAVGFAAAAVLGLGLALMRTSRIRLVRLPAAIYTELFKNIPLLVIVFVLYFGLPETKDVLGGWVVLGTFNAGALALAIFYAAYLSEIFRAALSGVHDGQREAAQALGLGRWSIFAHVVFPQALRLALPGTNTMLVDMLKSTSLLITISAGELLSVGQSVSSQTFEVMEVYLVLAAIYFAMCYPLSQALLWLERRVRAGAALSVGRRQRLRTARRLLAAIAPAAAAGPGGAA
jgi:His/Glu/Gln/Arg/opine family amino acid ABC transporter permease subunit